MTALCGYLAAELGGVSPWPALAAAWMAALLSWPRIDRPMRRLSGALLTGGAGMLLAVAWAGFDPDWQRSLAINMPIVALFIGISFLSLASATMSRPIERDAPATSVWRTMAHVNLIGAVINLSMVTIVGDRICRGGTLDHRQTIALVRSYCAAAFWSPFFVAAAVAATYAPGADPFISVPLGIIAALAALLVTGREVNALGEGEFAGYRPDRGALVLSLGMVVAVLGVKTVCVQLSIVTIVATLSPLFALVLMPKAHAVGRLRGLLTGTLPSAASQIVLFLAAGVFAHGAASALASFADLSALAAMRLPVAGYSIAVALIVIGAYLGLHPLVSIAAISAGIAPMEADPSLLAFTYLSGWAIATAAAPLSGINLLVIGRYRVAPRDVLRWHPAYAAIMWVIVTALMIVAHAILHNWAVIR